MRAHAMRVISLAFSSASTRKFTCTKILAGRFCANTRVPIKAPYVCLSVCSKTIQHESTYARDFPCKLREKYPTTCNQALYFKCTHIVYLDCSSLKQRTMMRMRICRHFQQTGGREISLATLFRHRFFYKTRIQH